VNSGFVPAVSAAKTLCITWRGIFQQNDLIFPPLAINNNDVHIRITFTMQRDKKQTNEKKKEKKNVFSTMEKNNLLRLQNVFEGLSSAIHCKEKCVRTLCSTLHATLNSSFIVKAQHI